MPLVVFRSGFDCQCATWWPCTHSEDAGRLVTESGAASTALCTSITHREHAPRHWSSNALPVALAPLVLVKPLGTTSPLASLRPPAALLYGHQASVATVANLTALQPTRCLHVRTGALQPIGCISDFMSWDHAIYMLSIAYNLMWKQGLEPVLGVACCVLNIGSQVVIRLSTNQERRCGSLTVASEQRT